MTMIFVIIIALFILQHLWMWAVMKYIGLLKEKVDKLETEIQQVRKKE